MYTADDFVAFIKSVRDDDGPESTDRPKGERGGDHVEIVDRNRATDPYGWTTPDSRGADPR